MVQHEPAGYEIMQFGLDVMGWEFGRATVCLVGFVGADEGAFGDELAAGASVFERDVKKATAPPPTTKASKATSNHGSTEV